MSTVYQKYADRLPVISFALGLFSVILGGVFLPCGPVLAILGLIAGFMGRRRFMGRLQSNQQRLALAGIIMNAFYLLVILCSTILLVANHMATT